MDLQNLINAIIPYGLPSLIIGVTVGTVFFAVDKLLKKKDKYVEAYLPLTVGFIAYLVYAFIFTPVEEIFSEGSYSSCLICGSVSAGVFVFIKNLKNGDTKLKDGLYCLLSTYTDLNKAKNLSKKIAKVFSENLTEKEITDKILSILKEENLSDAAAKNLLSNLLKNFAEDRFKDKR